MIWVIVTSGRLNQMLVSGETLEKAGPEHKPWGMYEFSLSGPDETLVRVGWPSRLSR
jgi:hypothetical protein